MADKTQVRDAEKLLQELLKVIGLSAAGIRLCITYIQGLSDGEATRPNKS